MAVMLPLLALVLAVSPPALPRTRAARAFSGWLSLCNAHDAPRMTAWADANFSPHGQRRRTPAQTAKLELADCKADGGYRLVQVLESTDTKLRVLALPKRSGGAIELRIALDGSGKVDRLAAIPTTPPEDTLPSQLGDEALKDEIGSDVRTLSAAGEFSGIVVVARGGKVVVEQSAGFADREKKTPITGSTRFTLASMGKLFTTTAVGQLVDAGKLSYDDKVGKFFPDFANREVREKVTLGMLLSHTGGLGDFLDKRTPEMLQHGVKRAAEFIPLFEKDPLLFPPGTSWSYSNAGLALAGAIVEKVSGEDFPAYLRAHIFAPVGMTGSDPNDVPHSDPQRVTPYTRDANGAWTVAPSGIGSPAGGEISTADDLIRFADALEGGKLVSPATLAQIITPRAQGTVGPYGYGIEVNTIYGQKVIGHGGDFFGVSTDLAILHGSPYVIVVLSNLDPWAAERVSTYVKALVAERLERGLH